MKQISLISQKSINRTLAVSAIALFHCIMGMLDVMVSKQYETDGPNNCISAITNHNLCHELFSYQILTAMVFVVFGIVLLLKLFLPGMAGAPNIPVKTHA